MTKVLVVGSINMDFIIKLEEIPKVGETLLGESLEQVPGGKGANQAIALSRLGTETYFLGKIGRDNLGESLIENMKISEIKVDNIEKIDGISTGMAMINVDKDGNNNIVVVPGANAEVNKEYLKNNEKLFKDVDAALFQFELPIDTVNYGLEISKKYNKTTIVNPAPAMDMSDEMLKNIDILIPNEHELARIAKMKIETEKDLIVASRKIISKGVKDIIVTLGSKGVMYVNKDSKKSFAPYKVNVVDTVGAGDSFIGGFVSEFLKSKDIDKAIDLGQKAAALTIQKVGAQTSIPTSDEIYDYFYIEKQN